MGAARRPVTSPGVVDQCVDRACDDLAFLVPTRTYDPMTRKHSIRRLFADREDRPIA